MKSWWCWCVFDSLCLCVRFPNTGQSCYMNSSLQSLLALEDFVRDFSCQERVWSSVPMARLLRYRKNTHTHFTNKKKKEMRDKQKLLFAFTLCRSFLAIRDAHTSSDYKRKIPLLSSFKEAVSAQAPEFRDQQQKVSQLVSFLIISPPPDCSPLCTNSWCVTVCLGRSRVPDLSPEPDEGSVPSASGLCNDHGEDIHLPCWESPGVQDGEHQDLQEVKLQSKTSHKPIETLRSDHCWEYIKHRPLSCHCCVMFLCVLFL